MLLKAEYQWEKLLQRRWFSVKRDKGNKLWQHQI
jgi:hypothetical protein